MVAVHKWNNFVINAHNFWHNSTKRIFPYTITITFLRNAHKKPNNLKFPVFKNYNNHLPKQRRQQLTVFKMGTIPILRKLQMLY